MPISCVKLDHALYSINYGMHVLGCRYFKAWLVLLVMFGALEILFALSVTVMMNERRYMYTPDTCMYNVEIFAHFTTSH